MKPMKYIRLSRQEIVSNWKLLKAISFAWMGQKWDCSGFILRTKQWKKSDWEWKGQRARTQVRGWLHQLDYQSLECTASVGRQFQQFTRNRNCRIHVRYCPKVWYRRRRQHKNHCLFSSEGRQTNQTPLPPLLLQPPQTHICLHKQNIQQ